MVSGSDSTFGDEVLALEDNNASESVEDGHADKVEDVKLAEEAKAIHMTKKHSKIYDFIIFIVFATWIGTSTGNTRDAFYF